MKQFFSLLFLFVLVSGLSLAQDFSVNPNLPSKSFGQIQYANIDATTITHSVDPVTVTALTGVSCTTGGITSDNQYWRAFVLADFGITDDFAVTMVEFGIETATGGGGSGVQPMTVNLYTTNLVFPTGTLTLIGTLAVMVPDQALSLYQIPVTGTAPAGSELVVEISIPADVGAGNVFYPGANSLGETADSWISSAGCGLATPVTYTSIGFPTCQLVMSVTGDIGSGGGGFPEILYYTFDEAGGTETTNYAVPGRGTPTAPLMGGLTMGSTGQFGSALVGAGGAGSTDYVSTGWITDLGTGSWTISMWLNNLEVGGTALRYLFGDNTAASFRSFLNGVAGTNNVMIRQTGMTDVIVGPVAPGPSVVHFVYDSSIPDIKGYLNGVLVVTVPQAALTVNGTAPFKVGGYSTSAGMFAGSLMDEFRLYDRALDAAEVAATWNISIVPVELTSFTVSVSQNDVKLLWETASEINNSGFNIERKSANSEYSTVGFVPGFGTTTEPKSYTFSDNNLRTGVYTYRLKQIDFNGTFEYSSEAQVEVIAPAEFSLDQNYPNPFNPSTKITFSLAVNSKVSLKVFDVLGQEVASLVNQDLTAGVHNFDFNAIGFNSGVYFYRIEANGIDGTNFTNVKKMILLK